MSRYSLMEYGNEAAIGIRLPKFSKIEEFGSDMVEPGTVGEVDAMISVLELLRWTEGTLLAGSDADRVTGVTTDSRSVSPGDLFIALVGERYDGHDFIAAAVASGATAVMINVVRNNRSLPFESSRPAVIAVGDTMHALSVLAGFYRKKFRIPVVGVTGSNGKTTTKEMIAQVTQRQKNVLKSERSFNNHIGVPLTVLKLRPEHELAVLELGMNHPGEIRSLSLISAPTVAVITGIGRAHCAAFASRAAIAAAKCEILEGLGPQDVAVLNADSPYLAAAGIRTAARTIWFGCKRGDQYRATGCRVVADRTEFSVPEIGMVTLPVPGLHMIYNALAAIAVSRVLGLSAPDIVAGLSGFSPPDWRMQRMTRQGIEWIVDCYNANPDSMTAALQTVRQLRRGSRVIAVLADMRELGSVSTRAHQSVGRQVADAGFDVFIGVGTAMTHALAAARHRGMQPGQLFSCADAQEAAAALSRLSRSGDMVLLKGSRALRLEKVFELFGT